MMKCEEARQMWHTRLETGRANLALDCHLNDCPACSQYAADMERITEALARLQEDTDSLRSFSALSAPSTRSGRLAAARFVRVAAVIALVLGLYSAVRFIDPRPSSFEPVVEVQPPGETDGIVQVAAIEEERSSGITLRGESAKTLLAVATPTDNPAVAVYWLYPALNHK